MDILVLVLELEVWRSQSLSFPSTQHYRGLSVFDRHYHIKLHQKACSMSASQILLLPLIAKLKEQLVTVWCQPLVSHCNASFAEQVQIEFQTLRHHFRQEIFEIQTGKIYNIHFTLLCTLRYTFRYTYLYFTCIRIWGIPVTNLYISRHM